MRHTGPTYRESSDPWSSNSRSERHPPDHLHSASSNPLQNGPRVIPLLSFGQTANLIICRALEYPCGLGLGFEWRFRSIEITATTTIAIKVFSIIAIINFRLNAS